MKIKLSFYKLSQTLLSDSYRKILEVYKIMKFTTS
jgi:hypothetical protein